jgi:small subunit ribosomal protein S21e
MELQFWEISLIFGNFRNVLWVLFCDLFPFLNPPFSLVLSSASNRIISAKDHASIQINIADVDETTGRMTGTNKTYAICGAIRKMGESDDCINRLAKKDGIIAK